MTLDRAVLFQRDHPVAYYSKPFGIANRNYQFIRKNFFLPFLWTLISEDAIYKEVLIIHADHKSLCYLQGQSLDTEFQKKAMAKPAGLEFKFKYKKGNENKAVITYQECLSFPRNVSHICCNSCLASRS